MNDTSLQLSDADLLLRFENDEDHFVERKLNNEPGDWRKTAVAFANSCPIGYPAVLFVGVKENREVQDNENLDSLQQKISKAINKAYPPIPHFSRVLERNGKPFLAVIIPGSPERPHFSGPSYVRKGPRSIPASDEKFAELIAQRISKVYEILKYKGQTISVYYFRPDGQRLSPKQLKLLDCNVHYVTIEGHEPQAIPLGRVEPSFDHSNKRFQLDIRTYP